MLRVVSAYLLAALALVAGREIVWKPATVLHARYKVDNHIPVMPGPAARAAPWLTRTVEKQRQ